MEFKITSTYCHNDHLLMEYPCLTDFGFEVHKTTENRHVRINDENGNRIWCVMPEDVEYPIVKINSLDELVAFRKAVDQELILMDDTIEIYDGYRE